MNTRLVTIASVGLLGVAAVLSGCSSDDAADTAEDQSAATTDAQDPHADMDHPADGGPVPAGMTEAADPEFPVGTKVVLDADHMHGMDGATATIVGAYDTFTYAVDFTPTTGGDLITDHKWVVQEEIEDAGDARIPDGTEVTLKAAHMDGMDGATATISDSTDETVYVVDYEADGMMMTNHKWVVESEIESAG